MIGSRAAYRASGSLTSQALPHDNCNLSGMKNLGGVGHQISYANCINQRCLKQDSIGQARN